MTVVMAVVQHETGRLVFNVDRESGISLKALGLSHEQKVT
jgi:hypothetical protein